MVSAVDGHTAATRLNEQEFDLIILDFRVPGTSSTDLAQLARKTAPHTKIILMTGCDFFDVTQNVSNVRFDGYLQKPFTITQFLAMVKRAVN